MTEKTRVLERLLRALEGVTPAERASHLEAPAGIERPIDRPALVPTTRDGYVVLDAELSARLKTLNGKSGGKQDA